MLHLSLIGCLGDPCQLAELKLFGADEFVICDRFCVLASVSERFPKGQLLGFAPRLILFRKTRGSRCSGGTTMRPLSEQLEALRIEAIECALIRDLSTDRTKSEFFAKLADRLTQLASDVEQAIEEGPRLSALG